MREHVVTDLLQRALFDGDDEPLPQPAAEDAGHVEAGHQRQGAHQRTPVGVLGADQRQDVAVDQRLQEQRGARLGGRADQDAQHDGDDAPLVLEDVAEDAPGGSGGRLLRPLRPAVHLGVGTLGRVIRLRALGLRTSGLRRGCVRSHIRLGCFAHIDASFHWSSSGWAWFLVCDS